jgi:hypothetical protein
VKPKTERARRRDQTARLPGKWRRLGSRRDRAPTTRAIRYDDREIEAFLATRGTP